MYTPGAILINKLSGNKAEIISVNLLDKKANLNFGNSVQVHNYDFSALDEFWEIERLEVDGLEEKLWRAQRVLDLLEYIHPESFRKAKQFAATLPYDSTMGEEMWSLAEALEKMKSAELS